MTNTTKPLIDAALSHLAIERCAACSILIPDTDPPLYVAVGPMEGLRTVLQVAETCTGPVHAVQADVEHDHSEGGHYD